MYCHGVDRGKLTVLYTYPDCCLIRDSLHGLGREFIPDIYVK